MVRYDGLILERVLDLNNEGYTIEQIAEVCHIPVASVCMELRRVRDRQPFRLTRPPRSIKRWHPEDFTLESTTVWSFPKRGNWATHKGDYRGNWSPYIPRNIILRYTTEGETVLDCFVGSGTTLIETKLLRRKGIGIDINSQAICLAKERADFRFNDEFHPAIFEGEAQNLPQQIAHQSVDLICTHPPYTNIIQYSNDKTGDLSCCDIPSFLVEMNRVAQECLRVLKSKKHCVFMIGDTRHEKHMVPLGFMTLEVFLRNGFVLKEVIIKKQHNCQSTAFWYPKSIYHNFLLIGHEYIFVLRKP